MFDLLVVFFIQCGLASDATFARTFCIFSLCSLVGSIRFCIGDTLTRYYFYFIVNFENQGKIKSTELLFQLLKILFFGCNILCIHLRFTTVYPGHIIRHQRFVHGGERPYECPHCDWKFAKSYSLRLHIASKHSDVACNSNNNNSSGGGSLWPKRKADEMEDETGW